MNALYLLPLFLIAILGKINYGESLPYPQPIHDTEIENRPKFSDYEDYNKEITLGGRTGKFDILYNEPLSGSIYFAQETEQCFSFDYYSDGEVGKELIAEHIIDGESVVVARTKLETNSHDKWIHQTIKWMPGSWISISVEFDNYNSTELSRVALDNVVLSSGDCE